MMLPRVAGVRWAAAYASDALLGRAHRPPRGHASVTRLALIASLALVALLATSGASGNVRRVDDGA